MRPFTSLTQLALVACLLLGSACAPDSAPEEQTAAAEVPEPSAEERAVRAARAALPGLFNIMIGLQGDMNRVDRGIWTARFDTIARGARSIAAHPKINADELEVVRGILGDEMVDFRSLDTRVHDLAVRLEEEAEAEDMSSVLETRSALQRGCVACHDQFRGRIREGVRR